MIYAASLARPGERIRVMAAETNAVYVAGSDGRITCSGCAGRPYLPRSLPRVRRNYVGEPHLVADPVARIGATGQTGVAASASELVIYDPLNDSRQFTWSDRSGKSWARLASPRPTSASACRPTHARAAVHSRQRRRATTFGCWTWIAALPAASPRQQTPEFIPSGLLMDAPSCIATRAT